MPVGPKRLLILAAGAVLFAAAAPPSARLDLDPAIFAADPCLAPAYEGCGETARHGQAQASASEAVLDAGQHPRLALDLAGLWRIGPEVTVRSEAAPPALAAR